MTVKRLKAQFKKQFHFRSNYIDCFDSDSISGASDTTSSSFVFSKYNLPNTSTSSIHSTSNNDMDTLSVQSFASDMSSVSQSTKKSKSHSLKSTMRFGSSLSQDSAFGSMTDDSNSIRTNSVQSIATCSDDGLGGSTTSILGSSSRKAMQLDELMPTTKRSLMNRQSSFGGPTSKLRQMKNKYKSEDYEVNVDQINFMFSNGCVVGDK